MPIYAYKCSSCGHAQDVLQKVSDALLTSCPQCHAGTFVKQLTAAGFQLRGSGWYATDFKNGSGKGGGASEPKGPDSGAAAKTETAAKTQTAAKTETAASGGGCGHGGCSACS
jgi:putative FmdB family regulatory protein